MPCLWRGDSSKLSDENRIVSMEAGWMGNYISPTFPPLRIEETWRLWQKFLDDFARFEEWLATSEKTAALPNSSGVLYTVAKEELKKFEVFQNYCVISLDSKGLCC